MKTFFSVLLGLLLASVALAQPTVVEGGAPKRSPEDLRKLLAPIALYPDALVGLILPASTNISDLVLASRYLAAQGDPKNLDNQPWDESVKSLARYPEVIKWMDENLAWTKEVGEAFAVQPADLMNTVQALRKEAQASGLLKDTSQQKVVVRREEVYIEPAQEDTIYVPYYDPVILVERRPVYSSWISFGAGFAVGSWLNYDCDWGSRRVVVYGREPGWRYHPDWRWRAHDPLVPIVCQPWRPAPHYWQHVHDQPRREYCPVPEVRPAHFVGPSNDRRDDERRRWEGRRDDSRSDQRRWSQSPTDSAAPEPRGHWDGHANVTHSPVAPPNRGGGEERPNGDRRGGGVRPGIPISRIDNHVTTPPAASPSSPGAPTSVPSPSPAPGNTPNWHQLQEHRLARPVDAGGQRTFPHQVAPPAPQHIAPPAEARFVPQTPSHYQRSSGYTPPQAPNPPATNPTPVREVRQVPQSAAPTPAAAPANSGTVQRSGDSGNNTASQNNPAPAAGRDAAREAHRALR